MSSSPRFASQASFCLDLTPSLEEVWAFMEAVQATSIWEVVLGNSIALRVEETEITPPGTERTEIGRIGSEGT